MLHVIYITTICSICTMEYSIKSSKHFSQVLWKSVLRIPLFLVSWFLTPLGWGHTLWQSYWYKIGYLRDNTNMVAMTNLLLRKNDSKCKGNENVCVKIWFTPKENEWWHKGNDLSGSKPSLMQWFSPKRSFIGTVLGVCPAWLKSWLRTESSNSEHRKANLHGGTNAVMFLHVSAYTFSPNSYWTKN